MKVRIHAKNVKVSNKSKKFIEDKISKIQRKLPGEDLTANVKIDRNNYAYYVEVTVPLKGGTVIRAEASDPMLQEAVLTVLNKLEGQIRTANTRIQRRRKKDVDKFKFIPENVIEDEEYEEFDDDLEGDLPSIVRVKRFAVKPMSPEEAVLQMELVGHDFFVFLDAETNDVSVVYKRKDGQYGLIEPQFD